MGQVIKIFLDDSGKVYNPKDPAPTLAAVFIPEPLLDAVNIDFVHLKKSAKDWGADTDNPNFEFSTRYLLSKEPSNKEYFAAVNQAHSEKMLKKMALVIARHKLLTLSVCFNRPDADKSAEPVFNTLPGGFDKRVHLAALFFGLVAGMCARQDLEASLIVDKDFVQGSFWHDALEFTRSMWPFLKGKGVFTTWSKRSEPEWQIHGDFAEVDSFQEYGVQLADLLANTVRRIGRHATNTIPYAELKKGSLKEVQGYRFGLPGINVFLQMHTPETTPPWRGHRNQQ